MSTISKAARNVQHIAACVLSGSSGISTSISSLGPASFTSIVNTLISGAHSKFKALQLLEGLGISSSGMLSSITSAIKKVQSVMQKAQSAMSSITSSMGQVQSAMSALGGGGGGGSSQEQQQQNQQNSAALSQAVSSISDAVLSAHAPLELIHEDSGTYTKLAAAPSVSGSSANILRLSDIYALPNFGSIQSSYDLINKLWTLADTLSFLSTITASGNIDQAIADILALATALENTQAVSDLVTHTGNINTLLTQVHDDASAAADAIATLGEP